jgi:hypothetical protein
LRSLAAWSPLCAGVALALLTLPSSYAQTAPPPAPAGAEEASPVLATIVPASPISIPSSVNVLILALDAADINSAQINNIRRLLPHLKDGSAAVAAPPVTAPPVAASQPQPEPAPAAPQTPAVQNPEAQVPAAEAPPALGPVPALPPAPPAPQHGGAAPPVPTPVTVPAVAELPARVLPRWRAYAQEREALSRAQDKDAPLSLDAPSTSVPNPSRLEEPVQRPPGRAQLVAAALRRSLAVSGIQDVLAVPLDGASVVRSINSGRITLRTVDALRFTTGQMLEAAQNDTAIGEASATQKAPALAKPRQSAIAAASRIGLAMGYRAVVVLAVAPQADGAGAVYSLLLVDAPNEKGKTFVLRQAGADQSTLDQSAAGSAASRIEAALGEWTPFTNADRATQVEKHLAAARAALQNNDVTVAQDHLNLAVSFDPSNSQAYVLLGDALQSSDAAAAAQAYQRAAEIDTKNGEVWAKIAIVHTLADPPDWIRSLQAANQAQQLGYDSANLRTAMAAAEFGRAELLRRGGRIEQAEDAELVARRHLDRARELAPDNPEVSASISRLMAKYLLDQKRYKEAVQSLDLLAIQYPNDLQTQTMYARALEGYGRRDEDTFLAWARVWKLSGESQVPLDAARYAIIADGFDQRLANLGKSVFQLTYGFSTGAILREAAILQTKRAKDEFAAAVAALRLIQPPPGRVASEAHVARLYAADLMQLALEHYSIYLETGNDLPRTRAVESHRQAIENLNIARNGGATAGAGT